MSADACAAAGERERMSIEWERRLANLWTTVDDCDEGTFVAKMERLVAELPPDSAIGAFERAGAFDSTGQSDRAVPLYRVALARGLADDRRRQATIQLASSLRNVGQAAESVALLRAERDLASNALDDAVSAFLALALVDIGREREAVSVALGALAPHLVRYRRSLDRYARLLAAEPDAGPSDGAEPEPR